MMATNAVAIFPGLLKLFMKHDYPGLWRWVGLAATVLAVLVQVKSDLL